MAQDKKAPSTEGATPEKEVKQETAKAIVFTAEDKTKYELTVEKFTFKGKKYVSKEAVKDNADVLQALVEANSFILKKV